MKKLLKYMSYYTPFDGDDDAAAQAAAAQKVIDDAAAEAAKGKSYSQEELDKILGTEKAKQKKANDQSIKDLEALKKRAQLTGEDREMLEQQIELLKDQSKSKEELAKKAASKAARASTEKYDILNKAHTELLAKHDTDNIKRALLDASSAVGVDAFDPSVIRTLLIGKTELMDVLDEDGDVIGKKPFVKMESISDDGKPITLTLNPKEAVKVMKESGDYNYLFKGKGASGLGKNNRGKGTSETGTDIAMTGDMKKYKEMKAKGLI